MKNGSSVSTTFSGQSVESDLASSTDVDSGYSSSVDVRRFRHLYDENSSGKQKARVENFYENASIRKQDTKDTTYELMYPASGPVSSPIPIPRQSTGELRFVRIQNDTSSTPPSRTGQKCPLDLNFSSPRLSAGETEAPSLVTQNTSTSLPPSSATELHENSPRLSRTVSPRPSKKSQRDSGIGETLAQDLLTFSKGAGGDKSSVRPNSKKAEEEDIYEELSGPFTSVPSNPKGSIVTNTSSSVPLTAHKKHSYENYALPLKQQLSSTKDHAKDQSINEADRSRCNSANQVLDEQELRDSRCNTWPSQQNYVNHKLKEAGLMPSDEGFYDNHKLRTTSDAFQPTSDACYDNWKISNKESESVGEFLREEQTPCYENVELQTVKHKVNNGNLSQKSGTSLGSHEETLSNQNKTREERCNNSSFTSHQKTCMYECMIPKYLQNGDLMQEYKKQGNTESIYENCETVDYRKDNPEEVVGGMVIPRSIRQNDSNSRKLCRSLPTNCHCVGVAPGDPYGLLNMILEKRSQPLLTRVGSADAIRVNAWKDDPLTAGGPRESGDHLDLQGHPVPPPRWKRLARMKRPLSFTCCSHNQWEITISPELASVLSKRLNGSALGSSAWLKAGASSLNGHHSEAVEMGKPCLPPPSDQRDKITTKARNSSSNAYENVRLPCETPVQKNTPPELPPKLQWSNEKVSFQSTTQRARALHYENVNVVNDFHAVSQIAYDSSPPPLPRKLSKAKPTPIIPRRVDLEQQG